MLANALIFLLGLFAATLAALIFAPVLWRKAQRLARREFEATVPISANEIRAEFDRVRAEAALTVRRQEVLSAETRAKAARSEAERGRVVVENTELARRAARFEETMGEKDEELAATRERLAAREEEFQTLSRQIGSLRHDADLTSQELEALATRFRELTDVAEERKIQLIAAEATIDRLADKARGNPREGRGEALTVEKLAGEIATLERTLKQERAGTAALQDKVAALVGRLADREEELARLQPEASRAETTARPAAPSLGLRSPALAADGAGRETAAAKPASRSRPLAPADEAENADIRERISDIAARVIRMTALAEGPDSPLADLLERETPRPGGAAQRPTLADRVRRLAEAERGEDRPG